MTEDETTRVIERIAASEEWVILNRDPARLSFRFNDITQVGDLSEDGHLNIKGSDVYLAIHEGDASSFVDAFLETLGGFGVHCHFEEI